MAEDENNKLLQQIDVLRQNLYQGNTARRTASLVLPRSSGAVPTIPDNQPLPSNASISEARPRTRRTSMSPSRSRPQPDHAVSDPSATKPDLRLFSAVDTEKKGIWSWKPVRALSHIGMHRLAILLSVEVVAIRSLPASMNGLRLSVTVLKKDNKEGAVQTMPSRVLQGAADFEETLFIRTHIFYSGGGSTGKPPRFEPRHFLLFPIAVDAPELDFGRSSVDLSMLVKESMEKSFEGHRVRQWDTAFKLLGKAKGGELVIKLGFQIMEDGGLGIYRQPAEIDRPGGDSSSSSSARRQSKFSFSIASPRSMRYPPTVPPSKEMKGIEEFNLDEDPAPAPAPAPPPPQSQTEVESKADDLELPDFEVVDKGIEAGLVEEEKVDVGLDQTATTSVSASATTSTSTSTSTSISVSTEVVKEVVHNSVHSLRLTELDSITKQIKALESMMMNDGVQNETKPNLCNLLPVEEARHLNAEEEMATNEFLKMLELEGDKETSKYSFQELSNSWKPETGNQGLDDESKSHLSDLGKGLGPIVRTKDGGYLASMNPFNMEIAAREAPKLAMQISRPVIIDDPKSSAGGGFGVFQKLAGMGLEELELKLLLLIPMDELTGRTAEQIAFEGIASAIVSGRSKEMARSAAAESIAALNAIGLEKEGRKERMSTGICNMLSFSLKKMEAMAIGALKLQAGVTEEEAPFDISPIVGGGGGRWLLDYALPLEDWLKKGDDEGEMVVLMVLVQLRDPVRQYEAVGAPMIVVVQAARVEGRYKVCSLHVGGMKLSLGRKTRSVWDGERQRLAAMRWLAGYGMGKGGKKGKMEEGKGGKEIMWSFSARVMADMWLKPTRNPDIKLLRI